MALDLTPRFRTKNVLATLAMVSLLLLTTGCGEEEKAGQSGSGSSTGTDSDKSTSSSKPITGKVCLPGTWRVDNESFRKFMGELGGNFNIATSGDVTLTLRADGSAETSYDHWTHDITVDAGKAVVERRGQRLDGDEGHGNWISDQGDSHGCRSEDRSNCRARAIRLLSSCGYL